MPRAPVVLGQNMITQALRDPAFYSQVPEFAPLRQQALLAVPAKKACGGCDEPRVSMNLAGAFTSIALMLDRSAAAGLCAYFGGAPLQVQGIHPISKQFKSVRLNPEEPA